MKSIILALASAACCAAIAPALAADNSPPLTVRGAATDDPYTIRVAYNDLNLANASEADMLRARVQQATRRTCGTLYDAAMVSQRWSCESIAWSVAKPQIDAALGRSGIASAGHAVVVRFARR